MPKGSSKKKRRWPVWIAALALLAAAALALLEARPHTSQVPVEDGTGTIYITPIPGLPVSSFTAACTAPPLAQASKLSRTKRSSRRTP